MPRRQRGLQRGRRIVLRSLCLSIGEVLHTDRDQVQLHQGYGLLLGQLHLEPVHVRAQGLHVHRARAVLQRVLVRQRHVHLSAGHPRLSVTALDGREKAHTLYSDRAGLRDTVRP